MSITVLPFSVMERDIIDKEVLNRYYHSAAYQLSMAISSILIAATLAFIITLMVITMTGMRDPVWYFIAMFASLVIAEAFAILISHVAPHFVVGLAFVAMLYGFFMLCFGFVVLPSRFPGWMRWAYYIAFHTYCWRTFMITEFGDNDVIYEGNALFRTGEDILRFYEIDDVERHHDMIILAVYAIGIHMISVIYLYFRYSVLAGKIDPPIRKGFTTEDELVVFFRIG